MIKEHRFNTGEVELNYAKGPDNGPPLVLLHGIHARWQEMALTIMPYLILRHTVYAVDLRGHGKSGRVPGRYRGIDYGEDVRALIEGVIREPAIVDGGLLPGGIAAVHLAAQDPALVRALVLEEPVLWDTVPDQALGWFRRWREIASLGKTAGEIREIWGHRNAQDRARAVWLSQLDPGR